MSWLSHWFARSRTAAPSQRRRLTVEELETRVVPTLLGQSLFPANNPWNQPIATAPVAANSTTIINDIIANQAFFGASAFTHPDFGQDTHSAGPLYGIPYNVVHGNTTPKVHVTIDAYPGESDLQNAPIVAGVVIEGDIQNGPNHNVGSRGDSHLIVWDQDTNIDYEFYHASRPSENGDGQWHADQETVWNMNTNTFRTLGFTSADAAGLAILPGLIRPDEGLPGPGGQGAINHALRFTLNDATAQFLYPASHAVTVGLSPGEPAIPVPLGARFRLKASFNIASLDPESQIIARALQTYGLICADIGSNFFFSGASYAVDANDNFASTWNDADIQDAVHGLKSLPFSAFEMVDLTPVVTGLSTHGGPAGTSVTVLGQNFSGAAGNLSVRFGGTPGTSVTVVDDSHITVTAPAGSGNVDVQVQSGVTNLTDASQNVTAPLFGYGLSALSANDKFLYGASNPATHFSVSATATDLAGNPVLFTVTALDAGNVPALSYSGTVHFTSSDGLALLPGNATLTNGIGTFTATLTSAGSQTITATDTGNNTIKGSSGAIVVSMPPSVPPAAPPSSSSVTSSPPAAVRISSSVSNPLAPPPSVIVTGADAGAAPQITVYDASSASLQTAFYGLPTGFTGGARVALGDVNGDGVLDFIVAAGPGAAPQITIYDGRTRQPIQSFFGLPVGFTGGCFVAAADVNHDGFADIIVSADTGGGPQVTITSGKDSTMLASFYATTPSFTGGIRISAADINGDGFADVIAVAGPGGGPQVTIFDGKSLSILTAFYAMAPTFNGGLYVAAGDLTGDGKADIVVGAGPGGSPQVSIFDGPTQSLLHNFLALPAGFTGGVRVAVAFVNGERAVVASAGPGGGPQVTVYDSGTLAVLESFFATAPTFTGGIFVA